MFKTLTHGIVLLLLAASPVNAADWVELFDGKTLNGWSVKGGIAKYLVEDGAIVGTTVEGSSNTFLCTNKEYGDFILELELRIDTELNSGIQIRSHVAEKDEVFWFLRRGETQPSKRNLEAGHVYGYQVEVVLGEGGRAGYVYDEARRAFFLGDNGNKPNPVNALKDNQWNTYRIECKGDAIKTSVNGTPCADFRDLLSSRGIIGLQVHSVKKGTGPYQVRFRNIRIMELD